MIKNIFLDAGGVILDENKFEIFYEKTITEIIRRYNKNYSVENYRNDAEEAVYRYVPRLYDYILYKNIGDRENFSHSKELLKNNFKSELKNANIGFELMDGIENFLIEFSTQYRIGILGQYGNNFRDFLVDMRLLRYFAYTETQDNFSITKPDPRYFEAILDKCGCKAEESVMIGDRIDKDIIPAKATGMKTIRLMTGLHKNQKPRTPDEIPDLSVERLQDITMELYEKTFSNVSHNGVGEG